MVARAFEAVSFAKAGGSALMKSCRPSVFVTLAIWALASDSKKASEARKNAEARAVRAAISARAAERPVLPWGRQSNESNEFDATSMAWFLIERLGNPSLALGVKRRYMSHLQQKTKPLPADRAQRRRFWRWRPESRHSRRIIATPPGSRELTARPFLGQLCLFRQPRPNRAGRRQSRLP